MKFSSKILTIIMLGILADRVACMQDFDSTCIPCAKTGEQFFQSRVLEELRELNLAYQSLKSKKIDSNIWEVANKTRKKTEKLISSNSSYFQDKTPQALCTDRPIMYHCARLKKEYDKLNLFLQKIDKLYDALTGKCPLYSVTVTRKGSSVLQRSERYFLGKIIECFLNNSDSALNTEELEGYIKEDIQEFSHINSRIIINWKQEISDKAMAAAQEIQKVDPSLELDNIKSRLIDNSFQSNNSVISEIITVYKEKISKESIEADAIKRLSLYEQSFYNKAKEINKNDTSYLEHLKHHYQEVWQKVQSLRRKYTTNLAALKNNYGLVVFNEMLFGKNIPFDEDKKAQVDEMMKTLSETCDKKILFSNVLSVKKHYLKKQDLEALKQKFHNDLSILKAIDKGDWKNANCLTDLFSSSINLQDYIETLQKGIEKEGLLLSNKTDVFFNGNQLYFYKKSSYFQECDTLLAQGVLYDFGDTLNHVSSDLPEADFCAQNILNAICYDFSIGIHKNRKSPPPPKVYIVQ